MADKTYDEVIEEHRLEVGAKAVHISLGPEATPEKLRDELSKQRDIFREWDAFPELLRAQAEMAQLKARLRRLGKLSQIHINDLEKESADARALRGKIFRETDIISMDISEAIEFCRKYAGDARGADRAAGVGGG